MDFSKVVINKLYDLKMTRRELALAMGIAHTSLNTMMRGKVRWSESLINKACEVLKIKIVFQDVS